MALRISESDLHGNTLRILYGRGSRVCLREGVLFRSMEVGEDVARSYSMPCEEPLIALLAMSAPGTSPISGPPSAIVAVPRVGGVHTLSRVHLYRPQEISPA